MDADSDSVSRGNFNAAFGELEGGEDVGGGIIEKFKIGIQDTGDSVLIVVELNDPADNGGVRAEMRFPDSIAEEDSVGASRTIFFSGEISADARRDSEEGKKVGSDPVAVEAFR